ncbi:MAG: mechanosensitive ion channel family protein [Nanoarchaeota archaeon]|nr:mechanosensitive ion channel family protein [Nanoarchaeota archaeon]
MVEVNNLLLGTFLENPYLRFIFIILVFYVISKIIQVVIIANIKRVTAKTKSKTDDDLIEAINKPLINFITLIGVKIAVNVIPLSESVLSAINKIIISLMVLVVAIFAAKIINVFTDSWGRKFAAKTHSTLDDDLLPLIHKAVNIIVFILAIIIILENWDIDVSGLLAGAGIAGLALAFAVKDSLANIFGGISIILDKTFRVNDIIKMEDGNMGRIKDIGLRTTKVRTWDNELLIVPNGILANSTIQNFKLPDLSARGEVSFGVEYGSDIDKVKRVVGDVLKSMKKVLKNVDDKKPDVIFLNMGEFALEFKARFWVENYMDKFNTKLEATEKIYKALNKSKISIPFPTRTVHLKK